jgi:hypothetical protein
MTICYLAIQLTSDTDALLSNGSVYQARESVRQFQLASAALCAIIPALGIIAAAAAAANTSACLQNAGARIVMAVLELFTFNTAVVKTLVHCETFL